MEVGMISFTAGGSRLCLELVRLLEGSEIRCAGFVPARYLTPDMEAAGIKPSPAGGAGSWAEELFRAGTAMVFIGAAGIAVRAIAPRVCDKLKDPAVVVMDEAGRFAIPVLSGHVGGANRLARRLAAAVGAVPVITTATDVNGCFAPDVFAAENGMKVTDRAAARQAAMDLLDGKPVGFFCDFPVLADGELRRGWLPPGCAKTLCGSNIHVGIRRMEGKGRQVLELAPGAVALGIGCRKGTDIKTLEACVRAALDRSRIHREAVVCLASIDVKRQEPAILELAARNGWELRFFSAEQLKQAEGEFQGSEFVERTVGVGNVCERAAVLAAGGGELILHKQAGAGVTVAAAVREVLLKG